MKALTDAREGLARRAEGAVVDAGDASAQADGKCALHVVHFHLVQDDRFQVTHRLGGSFEVGKLPLLEDGSQRLLRRRPRAAIFLKAKVVERRLDGNDHVSLERILRVGDAVAVSLAESFGVGGVARARAVGDVKRGERAGGRR